MGEKIFPVRISLGSAAETYTAEFQQKNASAWKMVLQKAHKKAIVTCLCPGSEGRKLAICHRSESDVFYLSRYKHSGPEHDLECSFYSADPNKSGQAGYSEGVIFETEPGEFKIKLELSLQKKTPSVEPNLNSSSSVQTLSKPAQPAMGALGLLHFLWTEAGLNTWSPGMSGKRNIWVIHSRLTDAAAKITVSRSRLHKSLVIAAKDEKGTQAKANDEKVRSAVKNNRRMLIIAIIAAYRPDKHEGIQDYLSVSNYHGLPRIKLDAQLWNHTQNRFQRVISAWKRGERVVAIVQTDAPVRKGNSTSAEALNIALMTVSAEWIPVESSYEARIEEKLRSEGRRFIKPLRHDSGDDCVFPDFILKDAAIGKEVPMEVFGLSSSEYLARKQLKTDYYTKVCGPEGWWSWDAASDIHGQAIPEFPIAR